MKIYGKSGAAILMLICLQFNPCSGEENRHYSDFLDSLSHIPSKNKQLEFLKYVLENEVKYNQLPENSLKLSQMGLAIAEELNDIDETSYFHHSMALAYFYLGDYDKAMEYNLIDLELFEQRKDTVGIIKTLDNIGNIPFITGDYEKALKYYLKSLKLAETIECDYLYYLYTGVGKAYYNLNKDKEAEHYYRQSLESARESGHENGVAMSYFNLSELHRRQGNNKQALEHAFMCEKLWKAQENQHGLTKTYNQIAGIYAAEKAYDKAIEYAQMAKEIGENSGFRDMHVKSLDILSEMYVKAGNYEKAFLYVKQYARTKDELLNEQKLKEIQRMQTNFEIRQQQHELDLLAEKNKSKELKIQKSRYLNYLLIISMVVLAAIVIMISKQYRVRMQEKNIVLERKLLRAQMNPHFIFNSLIAIQSFLYESKPEEAARFLSMYAELMRMILENSRQEYVPLEKEIKTLKHYLELQKLRFENNINYKIRLDNAILPFNTLVPPMLAQPFLENALEHGFSMGKENGFINIHLYIIDDKLFFEIADNGIGREQAAKRPGKLTKKYESLATKITKERLDALNRHRKEKIRMDIHDLKNEEGEAMGTKIVFIIPTLYRIMNKTG